MPTPARGVAHPNPAPAFRAARRDGQRDTALGGRLHGVRAKNHHACRRDLEAPPDEPVAAIRMTWRMPLPARRRSPNSANIDSVAVECDSPRRWSMMGRLSHDQRRLIPPASSRDPSRLWPAGEPAGRRRRGVRTAQRSTTADARQEFAHVPGRAFSLFTPAEHQLANQRLR